MKTISFIAGLVLILFAGFLFFNFNGMDSVQADAHVTLYKSPTCGCCQNYVAYLRNAGYEVEVKNMEDLTPIKEQYGIPPEHQSCHTTIVDGYFVEGHIPVEAIEKLRSEKPDLQGIALPGMPSGSPGMPGMKNSPFSIHQKDASGNFSPYISL